MPSVDQLKERLARTLKANRVEGALSTLAALAVRQPTDPVWPLRQARLLAKTRDVEGQVGALRRALGLQIDQSLALGAIATCKTILELAPADEAARDCLDRLVLHGGSDSIVLDIDLSSDELSDAASHSALSLRAVVPGSRSIQLGDAEIGAVSEIPVDPGKSKSDGGPLDLRLENWGPDSDLGDLAAAQQATLPEPSARDREDANGSGGNSSLRRELANIPLFGDLDPASLHTLIRRVRVVQIEAGQTLFREGDAANSLYVVVEGAVVPIAEGGRRRKLAVLERGEFFGEIGLLTKQPRNATIEGLVDTKLLAIDRRVLWDLIDKKPAVATNILRFLRARLIDRQIRTNLFFSAFAHAERDAVARQFRILEVADGARIVTQGSPPEGLFVVLSGALEMLDRRQDNKLVGELGLGDVFGGRSLLEGESSAVDVVARGKSWIVVLGESRFRKIVDANPRLIRVLNRLEGTRSSDDDRSPSQIH